VLEVTEISVVEIERILQRKGHRCWIGNGPLMC